MSLENAPQDVPLTDVVGRTPSLRRAYVLFMDIVGFGLLKTAQQVAAQKELSRMVQDMPEVIRARSDHDSFIARSTGDGMALLFFNDLLAPLRAALQIHQHLRYNAAEIKQTVGADLKMRMGIHAGEVTLVEDMNGHNDAAGEGIITAQRVMDLGDADHILLSSEVAKVLKTIEPWANYLSDLGEVRVKHKFVVHVFNLYGRLDGPFCGNPSKPRSVAEDSHNRAQEARAQRPTAADLLLPYRRPIAVLIVLGGLGYGGYAYNQSTKGGLVKMAQSAVGALTPKASPAPKPSKNKAGRPSAVKTKPERKPRSTAQAGQRTEVWGTPNDSRTAQRLLVPDLRGMDIANAEIALADFRIVRIAVESNKPADLVLRQSPKPNAKLASGGTIKLWVSKGAGGEGLREEVEPTPEPEESKGEHGDGQVDTSSEEAEA